MPGIRDGLTDRKELGIINVSLRKLYVNSTMLEKNVSYVEIHIKETQVAYFYTLG